eukprot:754696-Hanusia_phi.AAC.1
MVCACLHRRHARHVKRSRSTGINSNRRLLEVPRSPAHLKRPGSLCFSSTDRDSCGLFCPLLRRCCFRAVTPTPPPTSRSCRRRRHPNRLGEGKD